MKENSKEYTKENCKNNYKTFFDYYIFANIVLCFVLIKNNSYNLLSHIHFTISNSLLSQSIYNLVKKNDTNHLKIEKNNLSEVEKFLQNNYTCSNNSNNFTYSNNINNFDNIHFNKNEEWGWFVYFD